VTVKARLPKINQAAKTASLVFDNRKGRIVYYVESVRTGEPFQVITEVFRNECLQAKVQLYVYNFGEQVNERGNHKVDFCETTVCYQGLGALKARAKASGKILSVCKSHEAALRLLRFGGEIIKISNLGGGVVWGTVR